MTIDLYLDHAATSFPKPEAVHRAVTRWSRDLGVGAARGDSDASAIVGAEVERVRANLAARCGLPTERVAFCSGATEAVNLVLSGCLEVGDRVLTTDLEHASVARPLAAMHDAGQIELRRVALRSEGIDPNDVEHALTEFRPRWLVFTSASNVTGFVIDARRMTTLARDHGARSICDASQTAGLLPLDCGADIVLASAHKSLLAPPGLGFFGARPDIELRPTKLGGTGSPVASIHQPREWPTAFEAGTPNTPAIFGLGAALDWLASHSEAEILEHGLAWCDRLIDAFSDRARTIHAAPPNARTPVVSLTFDDMSPNEAGLLLAEHGIHTRSGFHCAPWIHAALGTEAAGTLRISPGPFVNATDVDRVCDALWS